MQIIKSKFPFEIIQADIAGEFVKSNAGNKWLLIVVDHFTKWIDAHAMKDATAETVARCLIKTILKYGIPDQILTDQRTNFQSEMLQHVYDILDIYKTRTTPYHPEADGGSEIAIKSFKKMITCYLNENQDQKDWDEKLDFFVYAHNTASHSTTGFSPFELLMGRQQKLPQDLFDDSIQIEIPDNNHEFVAKLKENFNNVYKLVNDNRDYKMEKAKFRHDRSVVGCNFRKNDKVWLLIKKRKKGITSSIAKKFEGPYTVLNVLNSGSNYVIKHDGKRSRAKTVNRSQLRICRTRIKETFEQQTIVKIEDETSERNNILNNEIGNLNRGSKETNNETVIKRKRGRPRKSQTCKENDEPANTTTTEETARSHRYFLRNK